MNFKLETYKECLWGFHGITSFYRKFIKNFSHICAPLIDTFRGSKQACKWIEVTDRNLKLLKKKITKKPIFSFPNLNKVFQVEAEASGIVVWAVLSQEQRLVAYFYQNLSEATQKYYSYYK